MPIKEKILEVGKKCTKVLKQQNLKEMIDYKFKEKNQMTKEEIIEAISRTDKTLGEIKKFFDEHSGETITDKETIEYVQNLEIVAKQLLIDLNTMRQYMVKEYGMIIFTENGV